MTGVSGAGKERYLTFSLGSEQYGIDIGLVKEIIAMMKVTHVPKVPPFITGVINLRGSIIPVVDTRIRFGMEPREADMHTAIVIVQMDKVPVGLIVDTVEEVATLESGQLCEPPKFGTAVDTAFICAMARIRDDVVMILDIPKLFEADELISLDELGDVKIPEGDNNAVAG